MNAVKQRKLETSEIEKVRSGENIKDVKTETKDRGDVDNGSLGCSKAMSRNIFQQVTC